RLGHSVTEAGAPSAAAGRQRERLDPANAARDLQRPVTRSAIDENHFLAQAETREVESIETLERVSAGALFVQRRHDNRQQAPLRRSALRNLSAMSLTVSAWMSVSRRMLAMKILSALRLPAMASAIPLVT